MIKRITSIPSIPIKTVIKTCRPEKPYNNSGSNNFDFPPTILTQD